MRKRPAWATNCGPCSIAAKANRSPRNYAYSRVARAPCSGSRVISTPIPTSTSRSTCRTTPARPACPRFFSNSRLPSGRSATRSARKPSSSSVFAEVSYDITSQFTAGVGGRYLKDYIESLNPAAEGLLVGGFEDAPPPVGGRSSIFNPSAYLRFKASENMTYYVQAAKGFRSGAPNQPLSYDPNGPCADTAATNGVKPLTDPDKLWTYELGSKGTWVDKPKWPSTSRFSIRSGLESNSRRPRLAASMPRLMVETPLATVPNWR